MLLVGQEQLGNLNRPRPAMSELEEAGTQIVGSSRLQQLSIRMHVR